METENAMLKATVKEQQQMVEDVKEFISSRSTDQEASGDPMVAVWQHVLGQVADKERQVYDTMERTCFGYR